MAHIPDWFIVSTLGVSVTILLIDLLMIVRRPHIPTIRESGLWVAFYVALAVIFGIVLLFVSTVTTASEFFAGWLTEYSLSIDNLFVFVVIMTRFRVPQSAQQKVLMVGIIIALIFRGIFILLGAELIENFSWIFYVFGLFLIITAVKQAVSQEHEDATAEGKFSEFLRKKLRIVDEYNEAKIRTHVGGKKYFTPLIVVFFVLGATDLIFAVDSIPAIFGITTNPFLVFMANIFALMGLRQLYFLLGGLLDRLVYLHYGIAAILAFIGVKLMLHALHVNELPFINGGKHFDAVPEISTGFSLVFIVLAMLVATVASVVKASRDAKARGHHLSEEIEHFTSD